MLKEIHEQADAVAETIADRLPGDDGVDLSDVELSDEYLRDVGRVVIVACGTSYHAGLIGRYAIEEWARVPVEMDIASEYRYRNPVVGPGDLVVGITQSGETADTLAAMRLAREAGAKVLTVTNIMGSQATRDADAVLYTRAGLEIGVAATKTFLAQVAAMYLLGLRLAELRGTLPAERISELVAELKALPSKVEETLDSTEDQVLAVATAHAEQNFFLYLGRHIGLPVCLEGALKLKEISYIPTDAYAAAASAATSPKDGLSSTNCAKRASSWFCRSCWRTTRRSVLVVPVRAMLITRLRPPLFSGLRRNSSSSGVPSVRRVRTSQASMPPCEISSSYSERRRAAGIPKSPSGPNASSASRGRPKIWHAISLTSMIAKLATSTTMSASGPARNVARTPAALRSARRWSVMSS